MNSKVRDYFRRESNAYHVQFNDFNQAYHVFEQIVESDIGDSAVEGLRERLPYALTKIAVEKLDRNDIITYFPIIWSKFEPYVKKLVLFADTPKYNTLVQNRRAMLSDYLLALGIDISVLKGGSSQNARAIYGTYGLRNIEAHRCESWGLRTFFDRLAQALSAYLLVTEEAIKIINNSNSSSSSTYGIDINFSQIGIIINPGDNEFTRFFRIKDFNVCLKRISSSNGSLKEFDSNGCLIHSLVEADQRVYEAHFRYDYNTDQLPVRRHHYSSIRNKDDSSDSATEYSSYADYQYNEDGNIASIVTYSPGKRRETKSVFYKSSSLYVDYRADGAISIHLARYKPAQDTAPYSDYEPDPQDPSVVITRKEHYEYDKNGLLQELRDHNDRIINRYEYNETGNLCRVLTRDGKEIMVETLGSDLLFYESTRTDAEQNLTKKMSICNDRVNSIAYFPSKADKNGDFQSSSTHYEI